LKLPNKTHPDSPIGPEANNVEVKRNSEEFKSKNNRSHLEIGEMFDLFDF